MVDVAAAVELDGALQRDDRVDVALGLRVEHLLVRRVEVGDIRLVVLRVVDGHDLTGDDLRDGGVDGVSRRACACSLR